MGSCRQGTVKCHDSRHTVLSAWQRRCRPQHLLLLLLSWFYLVVCLSVNAAQEGAGSPANPAVGASQESAPENRAGDYLRLKDRELRLLVALGRIGEAEVEAQLMQAARKPASDAGFKALVDRVRSAGNAYLDQLAEKVRSKAAWGEEGASEVMQQLVLSVLEDARDEIADLSEQNDPAQAISFVLETFAVARGDSFEEKDDIFAGSASRLARASELAAAAPAAGPPPQIQPDTSAQTGLAPALDSKWVPNTASQIGSLKKRPTSRGNDAYRRGLKFAEQKKWRESEEALGEAIQLEPGRAEYHDRLGQTLHGAKKYHEAVVAYREATALDSENADYWNRLGVALSKRNEKQKAIVAYQHALKLDSDNSLFHYNLGLVLFQTKSLPEAEGSLQRAIHWDSENAAAYFQLGKLYSTQKEYKEAETMYRKAIEIKPKSAKYHNRLGNLLYRREEFQQAEVEYRAAVRLAPKRGTYQANLAGALLEQKRESEARSWAEKASRRGLKKHSVFKKLNIEP